VVRQTIAYALVGLLTCNTAAQALSPDEILVVANSNMAESLTLARYYCQRRGVPQGRIVPVSMGSRLQDSIARSVYDQRLAEPIRRVLTTREDLAGIRCLVMTYGVPFKVGRRGQKVEAGNRLAKLRRQLGQTKAALDRRGSDAPKDAAERQKLRLTMRRLQKEIDSITGRETEASVDSELSLVLFDAYELYMWQPNRLRLSGPQPFKTLMVARLDGPSLEIAKGLVDKALEGEATGLAGTAYVDSRGMFGKEAYGFYDQSLRDLAMLTQLRTDLPVKEERTGALFKPDTCPEAALYCGWYSLRKYIDAFEFVPGAVGFHIASFEAAHLRSSSTEWCPAMLKDGITATLGPVNEPYLQAFPQPKHFFEKLFEGHCLVEAYYQTKPFNSWQMVLIGDPLYRPFPKG